MLRRVSSMNSLRRRHALRRVSPAVVAASSSKDVSQKAMHVPRRRRFSTSSVITIPKPWGVNMVESHGDYRAEAWLEDHVGGPLYAHQKDLPKLPVPTVADTLERFLPTALPLAESPQEASNLKQAVAAFPQQVTALQQRLEARASPESEYSNSSWLQHWWNTLGYLDVRDSVVINVSYYFHFADDSTVYGSSSPSNASPQIKRAAALLYTTAQVRNQVVTGTWPPEKLGKAQIPLCNTAFKYLFHACRIPASPRDSYRIYDPALHTHAAVMVQGHVLKIPLLDPVTHQPVSLQTLEQSLQLAIDKSHAAAPALGLSWSTTQNRDVWASTYESLDNSTKQALQILESAACLVCLDDVSVHTARDMAHLLLHGLPSAVSDKPINRWFDKSLQYIVTQNGKAGLTGEHSMMDGMPVVTLADKLATVSYQDCLDQASSAADNVAPYADFVFPPTAQPHLVTQEHQRTFEDWVAQHEIHPCRFSAYGSDWIKKQAKASPDAFVQMAMQIATYRLWNGEQGGTYEATQVRPFLHGRTETTRSVSPQSAALVQRFGIQPAWHEVGDVAARAEKLQLLQDAAKAHVNYIKLAGQAQGVDRHFLGLALSVKDGETAPDLFADPVFQRSKTWRVSTSNLSHPRFVNWGYGEVVPNGVGLSYSIHPHHLQFSVTALKKHDWTERLVQHLDEALTELQALVEAESAGTPSSKL